MSAAKNGQREGHDEPGKGSMVAARERGDPPLCSGTGQSLSGELGEQFGRAKSRRARDRDTAGSPGRSARLKGGRRTPRMTTKSRYGDHQARVEWNLGQDEGRVEWAMQPINGRPARNGAGCVAGRVGPQRNGAGVESRATGVGRAITT
jgi:hypothetical protein